ncbi:DUF6241 domain-containing protein [Planococcus sp. ISL-110]|uniref:DUF6241 domain-containing protein n=1 Tax=Planococcus sp. ISL-110 TaxID=2819167 RepID=UPI001BE6F549|nr:DUF6241 domain-containing protein [Planococcus sp. ISL-110]MBT2571651.1 hypothetical protein [Planococcus sp. ISL-110]
MKKTIIYAAIACIALAFIGIGSFKIWGSLENASGKQSVQAPDEDAIAESTEKVEGLEYARAVPEDASEKALLNMMHKMTHQKVVASEKWGLVRMNEESIAKAKQILQDSDFNSKEDLLEIIGRWESGQFDRVDEDHNYIWNLQGGSIGRATGILSVQQEQEFIRNNFSE